MKNAFVYTAVSLLTLLFPAFTQGSEKAEGENIEQPTTLPVCAKDGADGTFGSHGQDGQKGVLGQNGGHGGNGGNSKWGKGGDGGNGGDAE